MISLLIFLFFTLTAIGWLISTRATMWTTKTELGSKYPATSFNIMWLIKPLTLVVVGLLIGLIQPFALERVDASGVGFKVHLTGDNRGADPYEYKTGWVVYNTWADQFKEIATNQQHIEYDTMTVITKGGFQAKIKLSFNYKVLPASAADMYISLRKELPQIEQEWLKNAIYSSVNDVTNKWTVDSIFNWREQFESSIVVECKKRVSMWFDINQLRSNIMPPPALQASIEAKTKAIQDVQVAENRKKVAQAEAETEVAKAVGRSNAKIADARGDSAQVVINANAEAEAIRIQQKQLSTLYIDYIRASNWNGVLPTTVLGSGAGTLFQLK